MARPERSIDVSKYIPFFRLSCNIQTLFYWGRKGELYTSYHIRLISKYKDLKTKVVSWFSLVIGQNASRQLATSSENLVASAQFLVALATSESQFRALDKLTTRLMFYIQTGNRSVSYILLRAMLTVRFFFGQIRCLYLATL